MPGQIPLAISGRIDVSLERFIPGDNEQLIQVLRSLLTTPVPQQLHISGPSGSGKTHLLLGLAVAAEKQQLRCAYVPLKDRSHYAPAMLEGMEQMDLLLFDDIQAVSGDLFWEQSLFTLFNRAREAGRHLVFSADQGSSSLPINLADLKSRLTWGASYQVFPLNDRDKVAFLIQQAHYRGLELEPAAAKYLLTRCARDTGSLIDTFNQLDRASMAAQRKLTIPFIREQLH